MVRNRKVGSFSCSLPHFLFLAEMRKAALPGLLTSVGLKPCCAGDSPGCEEQALTLIFVFFSQSWFGFGVPLGQCHLLCHPRVGRGHRGDRSCLPGLDGFNPVGGTSWEPWCSPIPNQHIKVRCPAVWLLQSSPVSGSQAIPAQSTLILLNHPVVPQFARILNI